MILLVFAACVTLRPIEADVPCREAGYAISRRTFECTGDGALANRRYEAFARQYTCISPAIEYDTGYYANTPADLYHCAFAIGELACSLVTTYGDDLDRWLDSSPMCALVAAPP